MDLTNCLLLNLNKTPLKVFESVHDTISHMSTDQAGLFSKYYIYVNELCLSTKCSMEREITNLEGLNRAILESKYDFNILSLKIKWK